MKDTKSQVQVDNEGKQVIENIKLQSPYTIWYKFTDENLSQNQKINQNEYSGMVKQLVEFSNLDDFFEHYQYLKKPDEAKTGLEISLFKNGIKPMWEEEANKVGGKVTLKLKKDMSNYIWDELVLRLIGNSYPEVDNNEINGVMFSVKKDFNIIQIWFRNYSTKFINTFSASIKSIFQIPEGVDLDIRQFNKPKTYNNNYYPYKK
jgi:translation initiation factor 4E